MYLGNELLTVGFPSCVGDDFAGDGVGDVGFVSEAVVTVFGVTLTIIVAGGITGHNCDDHTNDYQKDDYEGFGCLVHVSNISVVGDMSS